MEQFIELATTKKISEEMNTLISSKYLINTQLLTTESGALRITSTLYILIFETFLVCNLLFLFGKALLLTIFLYS